VFDTVTVRTAYRCRAYPDQVQQQMLNRTFGCVRVVWNQTLAARDFLHRASTRLVRPADMIVIEDLAVRNMVRNRHLARAISDCGWGEFRRQLAYKCERYGRDLVVIGRWYPSSKTCSACGHRLAALSLGTRQWTCPSCGARHDRDLTPRRTSWPLVKRFLPAELA
jgi:IS605 OrfB family transposase